MSMKEEWLRIVGPSLREKSCGLRLSQMAGGEAPQLSTAIITCVESSSVAAIVSIVYSQWQSYRQRKHDDTFAVLFILRYLRGYASQLLTRVIEYETWVSSNENAGEPGSNLPVFKFPADIDWRSLRISHAEEFFAVEVAISNKRSELRDIAEHDLDEAFEKSRDEHLEWAAKLWEIIRNYQRSRGLQMEHSDDEGRLFIDYVKDTQQDIAQRNADKQERTRRVKLKREMELADAILRVNESS